MVRMNTVPVPSALATSVPRAPAAGVLFTTTDIPPGGGSLMHRILSLDYRAVLSEETTMKLDGGEKTIIKAGNYASVVQPYERSLQNPVRHGGEREGGHRGWRGAGCILPSTTEEGMMSWWTASGQSWSCSLWNSRIGWLVSMIAYSRRDLDKCTSSPCRQCVYCSRILSLILLLALYRATFGFFAGSVFALLHSKSSPFSWLRREDPEFAYKPPTNFKFKRLVSWNDRSTFDFVFFGANGCQTHFFSSYDVLWRYRRREPWWHASNLVFIEVFLLGRCPSNTRFTLVGSGRGIDTIFVSPQAQLHRFQTMNGAMLQRKNIADILIGANLWERWYALSVNFHRTISGNFVPSCLCFASASKQLQKHSTWIASRPFSREESSGRESKIERVHKLNIILR